jgi:hypothetical protein
MTYLSVRLVAFQLGSEATVTASPAAVTTQYCNVTSNKMLFGGSV